MKTRKITNFGFSLCLALAAGCSGSYAIAQQFSQFWNFRWGTAIAVTIGVGAFAGSQKYLNARDVSKKDIDKAVLNELKLKLSELSLTSSDAENVSQVIALYESAVEAQSTDQQTTLYQFLG